MPPPIEAGGAEELDKVLVTSYKRSCFWAIGLFVVLCGVLPGILHFGGFVFGTLGFTIWIAVFGLWCFVGGLSVILLPIYDFHNDVKAHAAKKQGLTMDKKDSKATIPTQASETNAASI
jgi:hypothetical protein